MIKKLINSEASSISSAAFVIGATTLAAKFLGLLRDSIFAHRFPVNDLDIYYMAFRIPDFIYNIIILGALSAGFIPVFTRMLSHGKKEEAFKAANNILNILFILISIFTLLALLATPQIIDIIAPGFDADKKIKTVELTRIMFLSPIFMLLSSITGSILQSYKRFLIYSFSPVVYNLGIIIGAEVFGEKFGLVGLAWGVPLGAFLQLVIQFPTARMLGYRYQFVVNTKAQEVRTIVKMMIPRTLTIIVSQINIFVMLGVASTLAGGSIAVFNLANNLQSFPLGIFAISFAIACFPTLSAMGEKEKREEFTEVLLATVRQVLFFIIPLSIFLIVFRAQAVRVILGHGHFDWAATIATIGTLEIFCFSLFAQSLIPLFSRAFWALHDSRTPFLASLFCAIVNIILAIEMSPTFGIYGLVWSFTVANILNAFLMFALLQKDALAPISSGFKMAIYKISFSAIIAGAVGYITLYAIEPLLDTHKFTGILTQGAIAGICALLMYFLLCSFFEIEEFKQLKKSFEKRVLKTNINTTEIIPEE